MQSLESIPVAKEAVSLPELMEQTQQSFALLAEQSGQQLYWSSHNLSQEMVHADKQMLFRTLENAVTNALRHAKTKVSLGFSYTDQVFTVRVEDDGSGFSVKALLS